MLGFVQRQLAAHDHAAGGRAGAFRLAGLVAAQQGTNTLQQQTLAEWLGDVVIRAQTQAHQLVHLLVLGGQEDHRHGGACAQTLQQFHPIHARHLDVQHRQIGRPRGQTMQRAFAIGVGADQKTFLLQRHRDTGQDIAVVVDQRDGLLHYGILAGSAGL